MLWPHIIKVASAFNFLSSGDSSRFRQGVDYRTMNDCIILALPDFCMILYGMGKVGGYLLDFWMWRSAACRSQKHCIALPLVNI